MGKLVAVNFYHQQFQNMSLPLSNPYIKGVAQGIKKGHVEKGTQARVRRPLTWGMLSSMQQSVGGEGAGGRVLWIGLALTYLLMLRASELFAERDGKIHDVYCLCRGDVAFFEGDEQLEGSERVRANKIEVHMRGSKGDQGRKGAVLVREKGRANGAVELMLELFGIYGSEGLSAKTPLMVHKRGGKWEVWQRGKATEQLRKGIRAVAEEWVKEGRGAGAKLRPEEFALHSGRIGGATRLAAKGVPGAVIKKEGRWSSDAFLVYVRANMQDPAWVSAVLEEGGGLFERQPGQGTKWGKKT